jgi:hypothetical protein
LCLPSPRIVSLLPAAAPAPVALLTWSGCGDGSGPAKSKLFRLDYRWQNQGKGSYFNPKKYAPNPYFPRGNFLREKARYIALETTFYRKKAWTSVPGLATTHSKSYVTTAARL